MSHLNPGLISAYNSLTDKHLAGYFSNTRIRRHLQRAGLITRSGRIVPDKEYRHKLIQRAHQRHVRECLAQAIFHKVLEMERLHQIEIKRKLEEFARRERVHKIKVERSRRYEEDIIRILSPRPPTGARGIRKQHSGPEGEHSESSESPGSSRPNTAPGKMQRPVRLKPIHSNSTTASVRRSSPYRLLESTNENDQPFNCTMDKESRRRFTTTEASCGISPYCLPVINNFVTPVPPATKRKERGVKVTPSGTLRGRRLRPTTASSGADVNEDPPMLRSSMHQSRVCVNMVYFGKTVHLSHDLTDMRDEVKVFQQHCGGENLCVYKGKLREGETFQLISRRHRGFPFSLTFFLNGLQVERLSSCCEFKHRKGSRLGGRHGHFGFSSVEGASPCYKCIIAMGLDKKPTPPPKRVKEDGGIEELVTSPKDAAEMEAERAEEETASRSDCDMSQQQDMETQVKEERAAEEDKVRDDYEEDFEADDEGPVDEAKEKKSPCPAIETETLVKERDASETEDDDEKDEDTKSRSGSSCSGSDREASDAEATNDSREDEKAEQPEEVDREEAVAPSDQKDEPNPEEPAATEAKSAAAKDSDLQDSAGDSTEIDISDTSIPSGKENKQSDDTSGGKEAEATVDEGKQEEEQEQERAKSVQEKLAEAILKESHCSSEPELSDTSTEEEEEATEKGHKQNNNDVVPEKSVTFTEQQPTLVEEVKCEESAGVGEAEVTEEQEETSEPKEREDETEKEPHENSDSTKEETEKIDEDDEKPASEEAAAEEDKSEDTGAAIHPALEETMEESKTSEPQEDAAAKPTDADAAQRDEENEEKSAEAEEAGTQPDETGQGAKSREGDESSVSDPNKKTDETAMSDNAEAEAMTASETMEMKAEPSEEREALSCEEAPVTDTEERQQGDSKDRSKASVTAENSNSMLGGSGDTTVEKTADVREDNAMDESSKDDNKEEEAEEFSEADASKDDNQQERLGEEQTEKSVEISNEVEKEKSEEQRKEEEKQTNPDETPEGENTVETEKNETDKTEEANDESKTEERIESEGNIVEDSKTDSNTEGQTNEEPAEKTLDEEDKVANEERADESEKTKKDDDSECVENKNDEEESETKAAITDKTNEGEEINEAKTDADEEKGNEAEQGERDDNELNKAEQSESEENKDAEESEEKKIITCKAGEGEEISDITEEPEKNADDVKISNENTVEPKDIVGGEAADGTEATEETEEMLNNVMESEDGKKEAEGASANSENGEIDAENGEINTATESKTHEDEAEASAEDKNDVKPAEHVEDERKTEDEPTEDESTEVKEVTVESGHDNVGQAPDTDMVESEAKEVDDSEEKQDESAQNDPERETVGTETKEESKADDLNTDREDNEEITQDENGHKSDKIVKENRDSDSTKNNGNNVNEVITASLVGQAQSSTPTGIGLDGTSHKLDESTATSDKLLRSDESAAAVDLSAADGENGADTEEASKASEEGASVLLKPRAQNNEADNKEESIAIGKGTPEALTGEDNTDLVTNWVTMHQTSKYFEKFVEPLEDLKEETSHTQGYISTQEATKPTELPRSESPLKMVKTSENEEKEQMQQDENDAREKTKVEAVESDLESELFEDGEPYKIDPAKDTLQEEEGAEVKDLIPKTETEENDEESINEQRKGSRGSLEEDKVQDGPTQAQNYISQTEVESIVGTHHSVASGKPESLTENKNEETDNDPDLNEKQIEPEEIKDLLPPSKTEEHREHSASPDGLKDTGETWWKTDERSREVTEITDFTTSKSDDGSQDESHNGEIQPKPSDGSVNRERRDMQLIQDIKHTLSKDRLSTFSVDETLFGRSSYPVLAAARTESGH